MNTNQLPILKFAPILKTKLWGGTKLHVMFNKEAQSESIGESWEISDVEGNYSIVKEGVFKGKTLRELLFTYKEKILGENNYKRFGPHLPLLIKFIDASKVLSVQVHPDDQTAQRKHNSCGKTEMWYVVDCVKDAQMIIGFNQKIDKEKYQKHMDEGSILEILNFEAVSSGDVFFVEPGLIHAIGAGVLLLEIQQTSDITYRIYDWDRLDTNGNRRDLHHKEALDVINFNPGNKHKISYTLATNQLTKLVTSPYFVTNTIEFEDLLHLSHESLDSFIIYICVYGNATISYQNTSISIRFGESILVPACIKAIDLKPITKTQLIQTYIS